MPKVKNSLNAIFIIFIHTKTLAAYLCTNPFPMKIRLLLLLYVVLFSCQKEINPAEAAKINGYWEIDKVILPDGQTKDYKVNTTIDYFEIKGGSGIRKKVTPQLDGKYLDNGHGEKITIVSRDGKTYLDYATEYAKWEEELIEVGDSTFALKNKQNLEYHYKKYTPYTLK